MGLNINLKNILDWLIRYSNFDWIKVVWFLKGFKVKKKKKYCIVGYKIYVK